MDLAVRQEVRRRPGRAPSKDGYRRRRVVFPGTPVANWSATLRSCGGQPRGNRRSNAIWGGKAGSSALLPVSSPRCVTASKPEGAIVAGRGSEGAEGLRYAEPMLPPASRDRRSARLTRAV